MRAAGIVLWIVVGIVLWTLVVFMLLRERRCNTNPGPSPAPSIPMHWASSAHAIYACHGSAPHTRINRPLLQKVPALV